MIELENVTKTYPDGTKALKNVDLRIEDGEFVFIVGASGAGKTTLSKLLLCEERVTGGKLFIDGFDLVRMPRRKIPKLRRRLGIVFQDFRLLPNLNVFENIAFAMHVVGEPRRVIKTRVMRFLKLVGLEDKVYSYPHQLSGGEQQRVAIARAVINNPGIIIADEPTGNIDPIKSIEMIQLLIKINKLGKTVVVITHEKSIVDYFNKRVVTISEGKITSDRTGGMFDEDQSI
ncbi:MAG: cell division ATP-binding protein FtsE [Clostridia bacterium]|nr:cell division ATP-binding protein FtsE [Clostridia bacterium]